MIEAVKHVVYSSVSLNIDDRNLVSVAFRNYVGLRRAALRVLSF